MARAADLLGRPPAAFLCPAPAHGRSRVDLMWHDGRLGTRGPGRGAADGWIFEPLGRELLRQVEPAVAALAEEFAASGPPHGDAQVRLRTAPDGRRGLWLDLSRAGIAALLAEERWLGHRLAAGWTIELGQRAEAVEWPADRPELGPATPHAWLPAWSPAGQPLPLECYVSSFTQPGPLLNRALLDASGLLLDAAGVGTLTWCEWGAGYGNLTAWLHRRLGPAGAALEADPRAVPLLEGNAARFFPGVVVGRGVAGLPGAARTIPAPPAELWIIDPPRPGFPALLRTLATRPDGPRFMLAWHCHERGLTADVTELRSAGHALAGWVAVDAFPLTDYLEVLSLWRRVSDPPARSGAII